MIQEFEYKNEKNKKYVYVEEYDPIKKLILNEGQNLEWYHFSDLEKLKIVDHDIEVLKYIKDKY